MSSVALLPRWAIVSALLALLFLPSTTHAQTQPAPRTPRTARLRYDLRIDLPVTLVGGAGWIASELLKGSLVPPQCRWCDRGMDRTDTLNGLDVSARNAFRWRDTHAADAASNITAFGLAPLFALGLPIASALFEGAPTDALVDLLVIGEAAVLAVDLNQLTKFLVVRERPYAHFASSPGELPANPSDNNLSFFSGHTTLTFALATAAGTVSTLRGYAWSPAVWASGMTMAVLTGYLRIAADRHYLTDVLVGAVIGSAMGFTIPYVFHRAMQTSRPVVVTPMASSNTFGLVLHL